MIYCSSSFVWEKEWGAIIVLQLHRSYWKHYLIFIFQNGFISVLPYVNNAILSASISTLKVKMFLIFKSSRTLTVMLFLRTNKKP